MDVFATMVFGLGSEDAVWKEGALPAAEAAGSRGLEIHETRFHSGEKLNADFCESCWQAVKIPNFRITAPWGNC